MAGSVGGERARGMGLKKQLAHWRSHGLRVALGLGLTLAVLLGVSGVLPLDALARLENYAYDLRLRASQVHTVDPRVVIVDIDESSLQRLGHWPWPRPVLARLVDTLFDRYHIRVMGFDVLFAERDGSSGLATLQKLAQTSLRDQPAFQAQLARLRPELEYDARLAKAIQGRPVVLGYYLHHNLGTDGAPLRVGQLPAPALPRGRFDPARVGAAQAQGYTANLPELQQAAPTAGFFNATPLVDADGVFRRVSLMQIYDGALYESLALAVTRLALQAPPPTLLYEGGQRDAVALEGLALGGRRIPADRDLAVSIPYRGGQGSFPYVSAADVLDGKVRADVLEGAIVLVGTTAAGLLDLRTTPVQEAYPGVEVHANLITAMLDGNLRERPAYVLGLELIGVLVVGVLLALSLPGRSPLVITVSSLLVALCLVGINLALWFGARLIVPLASWLVLTGLLFVLNMSFGFFSDARAKRQITRLFGQYVPPELVDEMAQNPNDYSLQGESRQLSVLFSDVRGFTTLSEGLDPQQLTALMNAYLTPMTQVIHRHRGTIDKYMGDAIMAFWGAPLADEQHATHAVQAALDMHAALVKVNADFKARGWPQVRIGVGINTGQMTVGNMGSTFRLAYTVMGDAVNLGSRLEGLTKTYGVATIVSEFTREQAPGFAYRELDCVRVKGKEKPVRIYAPLARLADASPELLERLQDTEQALQAYRARDWARARAGFAALQVQEPDVALHRLYLARIAELEHQALPPDWDGTITYQTK